MVYTYDHPSPCKLGSLYRNFVDVPDATTVLREISEQHILDFSLICSTCNTSVPFFFSVLLISKIML